MPQGAGISDYVSEPGDASLEALIRPTSVPGVRIITAGTRLAHPASMASRMGHLLAEAREMADIVLIDTAPLLAASDVFDILPMVDTVLLVVRSGRLTETSGNRVAELLGRFQVPVGGVILVGVRAKRADAYGYGYGEKSKSKSKSKSKAKSKTRGESAPQPREPVPAGTSEIEDMLLDGEPVQPGEPRSRRARRTSSA